MIKRAFCILSLVAHGSFADLAVSTNIPASPPDIIVVADRHEKSLNDVPGSVQVIDGDDLSVVTAVNVADALSTAVGLDIQAGSFPNSASRINMRGQTDGWGTKRVLVMVDGRPTHDAFQGLSEVGLMPVGSIERIEIVRGPASTLYGSQAESGAINIITRKAGDDEASQIDVSGGSFGTLRGTVSQEGRMDAVDYRVLAGYETTEGHLDNSDGSDRDWDDYFMQGNVGFMASPEWDGRFHFGAYEGDGTDENSEHDTRTQYIMMEGQRRTASTNDAEETGLTGRLYGNFADDTYAWKYGGEGLYDQQSLGASAQDNLWLGDRVMLLMGVDLRGDQVDVTDNLTVINEEDEVGALFLNGDGHLSESTVLSLGARLDEHDDFGSEITPRIALLQQVDRYCDVFASMAKAYRTPSLSDRYVVAEYNGMLFEGNEDLDPETVLAYELGMRLRSPARFRFETALFWNDMKDTFDFMMAEDGVFRTENVTASESYGVELSARIRLTDTVEGFADYTWTDGEYTEYSDPSVVGNDLVYLVHDLVHAGVDVDLASRVEGTLFMVYSGEREGDVYNSEEARLDDYILFNAALRMEVLTATAITVSVENIFDETYSTFPGIEEPGTCYMAGISTAF